MINILMNQKPGLTDSVYCPTMEIGMDFRRNGGILIILMGICKVIYVEDLTRVEIECDFNEFISTSKLSL